MLAALGPKMLELAAEQGARRAPVLRARRAHRVRSGGARRWPDALPRAGGRARHRPRRRRGPRPRLHMATYLTLPNYTNNLRRLGWGDDDLADGGSDELVDAIVAWGDEAAIVARVQAHLDAGADHVCVQVLGDDATALPMEEWRRAGGTASRDSDPSPLDLTRGSRSSEGDRSGASEEHGLGPDPRRVPPPLARHRPRRARRPRLDRRQGERRLPRASGRRPRHRGRGHGRAAHVVARHRGRGGRGRHLHRAPPLPRLPRGALDRGRPARAALRPLPAAPLRVPRPRPDRPADEPGQHRPPADPGVRGDDPAHDLQRRHRARRHGDPVPHRPGAHRARARAACRSSTSSPRASRAACTPR